MGVLDEEDLFKDAFNNQLIITNNNGDNRNENQILKPYDGSESIVILDINQGYRISLPHLRNPSQKISFFKILKEMIGKDLTKVSLPVYFNEPLSMTQRVVESNEYCDTLLEKAVQ